MTSYNENDLFGSGNLYIISEDFTLPPPKKTRMRAIAQIPVHSYRSRLGVAGPSTNAGDRYIQLSRYSW